MSLLLRMSARGPTGDLAPMVTAILADPIRPAPLELPRPADLPAATEPLATGAVRLLSGPTGLGTSAARPMARPGAGAEPPVSTPETPPLADDAEADDGAPSLYCPGAVRDDELLGETVNEELVAWAEQVGIYPGQLDRVRAANFGRLMMLTHPATEDPDRLLAAARCVLAEWATDDHFLDDESLGADAATIGSRMGVAYAAIDPANLPVGYADQLDRALAGEPVAAAYQSAFAHLARYANATQVARLRHELAVMFMAYNQEAAWRVAGHTPAVWEYLTHRSENSFLPPMVLVDPIAGYEVPAFEFADGRVRRVFAIAGLASVILNDLYSMGKESDTDFDLPKVLAHEEHCSLREAVERSVEIHNELMHTFVEEASALSLVGSLPLRRFLADIWAWLGGNREWHSTTARYAATA